MDTGDRDKNAGWGWTPASGNGNGHYAEDVTKVIGNTPLVRLRRLTAERAIKAVVLVKLEFLNPTASIKDRMVVFILNKAIREGELRPGGTIVEATSGNTGASVAMFAAANGYRAILTIPDKMSREKIDTLKAFGAEVHVCPTAVPADSPESYYETAKRIHKETANSFLIGQYFNADNIEAHYRITGPEIWNQTEGRIDVLVGGIGTGGTVSGVGRFLKEKNPGIQIVAVDPEGSVFYDYYKEKVLVQPHPYLVEGIGDDFLCPALDFSVIDKIYRVTDKECFLMTRELTRKEGIFGGGSSGGAVHAALLHAAALDEGKTVVVLLPDSGGKYITKIFSDDWMREKGMLE
jgi:cystathionine beta-synthase